MQPAIGDAQDRDRVLVGDGFTVEEREVPDQPQSHVISAMHRVWQRWIDKNYRTLAVRHQVRNREGYANLSAYYGRGSA